MLDPTYNVTAGAESTFSWIWVSVIYKLQT